MSDELLATYSGLGTRDGDNYYKGEECLACVKDLIRGLRSEENDTENTIRRYLGAANILSKDLIPLLEQCDSSEVVLKNDLIRLMANLTQPVYLCVKNEIPVLYGRGKSSSSKVRCFMELEHYLMQYKEAFTRPNVMNILGIILAEHCQKEWDEREEEDTTLIERILLLIRNILHIPTDLEEEKRTHDDVSLHDQIIWNLHINGIDELLIFLASNEEERHWCMHVLEIVFHMLNEQDPVVLATAGQSRSQQERERDDKLLGDLLKLEETKKKKSVKLLGSRSSRFGGTFVSQSLTSISDNQQVFHKPLSSLHRYSHDTGKTMLRKPVMRRQVPDRARTRFSTYSIRIALKEFCIQFLECCYNPIIRVVKDNIQQQRAMENDDTYYLWAVRFFMEFNRRYKLCVEVVGETMTMGAIHYIIQLVGTRYENMMLEKNPMEAQRHSQRLDYAILAYREVLEYMKTMSTAEDRTMRENAKIIQSNIFYHQEYRDIFINLLKAFKPGRTTRTTMKNIIETVHLYLHLLEHLTSDKKMLAMGKRKKRQKRKSSNQPPSKMTADQLQSKWSEIQVALFQTLLDNDAVELEEQENWLTEDTEKMAVARTVKESLLESDLLKAISTLRAARLLWPGDLYGASHEMDPEKELDVLHNLFLSTSIDPTSNGTTEVDVENLINEEDEICETETYEMDFNLEKFLQKFTNQKVLQTYCYMLTFHSTNSDHLNHCIVKMLHRIVIKLKMAPLLFHISVFRTFHEILASSSIRYKELEAFAKYVLLHFFKMAETNPLMFVELLFWKTPADCIELTEGYGTLRQQKDKERLKHIWKREEEEELAELYEKYMEEPDIVGNILVALTNQNRSRQGVARQIVKMGLVASREDLKKKKVFKRVKWTTEEDDELRQVYLDNSELLQDGGELDLLAVAERFPGKTADSVERRLVSLGLVKKKRKKKKSASSEQDVFLKEDELEETDQREQLSIQPTQRKKKREHQSKAAELIEKINRSKKSSRKTFPLSGPTKSLVQKLTSDDFSEALLWLQEYLIDEAKDRESSDSPSELCVVPIGEDLCKSLRSDLFEQLMYSIGLQPPDDTEIYWRIPDYMTAAELHRNAALLTPCEMDPSLMETVNNNTDTPTDQLIPSETMEGQDGHVDGNVSHLDDNNEQVDGNVSHLDANDEHIDSINTDTEVSHDNSVKEDLTENNSHLSNEEENGSSDHGQQVKRRVRAWSDDDNLDDRLNDLEDQRVEPKPKRKYFMDSDED